eukprot:1370220-Rhodomonas_salina.2
MGGRSDALTRRDGGEKRGERRPASPIPLPPSAQQARDLYGEIKYETTKPRIGPGIVAPQSNARQQSLRTVCTRNALISVRSISGWRGHVIRFGVEGSRDLLQKSVHQLLCVGARTCCA